MEKSKPFTKCTLRQRYHYYRQQNAHQQFNGNFQQNSKKISQVLLTGLNCSKSRLPKIKQRHFLTGSY